MARNQKNVLRVSDDSFVSRHQVKQLFGYARVFITFAGWIFIPFVAYVQLKGVSLATVITNTGGYPLTQIALVLYYYSWVSAGNLDSKMFESVYSVLPDKGKIPKTYYIQLPILLGAGALLFLTSKNETWLALSLLLFFVVDVAMWMNNVRLARPMVRASARQYQQDQDYYDLERLAQAERYLCGSWQHKRYAAMVSVLLVYETIVFATSLRTFVGSYVSNLVPGVSATAGASFATGIVFCIFVITAELTVWSVRLKTKAVLNALDQLRMGYKLAPRT